MHIYRNLLFVLVAVGVFSCNYSTPKNNVTSDKTVDTLKQFSDVKITLLDGRNEKAEILLGKPDVRGRIMEGNFYYMVYFDKVSDGGKVKNLVIFVDAKKGINDTSPIYKMVAVSDGETVERAGNFAQWLRVSKDRMTSNSMDFNYGKGTLSWADVELGRGEIIISTNKRSGIITSVNDLPIPSEAIKSDGVKKYTVKGVNAREVYLWYANNYHATLQSNEASDHKYLYMPFNANDSCILLTMTGHIDGSILLEFSFECGD